MHQINIVHRDLVKIKMNKQQLKNKNEKQISIIVINK